MKVGLAVLLKVTAVALIGYLSAASFFILPAAVLLIYLLYKLSVSKIFVPFKTVFAPVSTKGPTGNSPLPTKTKIH